MTPQNGQQIMWYIYYSISQEVKTIRQWNLGSKYNAAWEIFFLKNQTENEVGWLVPDFFVFLKKLYIR